MIYREKGSNRCTTCLCQAYVSYKILTKTSMSQYKSSQSEVIRRFRDFAWLYDKIHEKNKGIIVPPLPEKNAVQKYQMSMDFIEQRRRALEVFINRVVRQTVSFPYACIGCEKVFSLLNIMLSFFSQILPYCRLLTQFSNIAQSFRCSLR